MKKNKEQKGLHSPSCDLDQSVRDNSNHKGAFMSMQSQRRVGASVGAQGKFKYFLSKAATYFLFLQ